ncbi:MAG: hypothetical protein ACI9G6_000427 [Limisphaerales bacterium]|jgi:hypothetical protein
MLILLCAYKVFLLMKLFIYASLLTLFVLLPAMLWAQPANDACSGAISLEFNRILSCPADDGTTETVNTAGTNVGATPVAPFPSLACTGGQSVPASEVWYTFRAAGKNTSITIDNATMAGVQLVVYLGDDCNNLQAQACAVNAGPVSTTFFTSPGQRVYFFVAGANPSDVGTYDITLESTVLCGSCFQGDNGFITLSPLNATGVYGCGESVDVCFTLTDWEGNASGTIEWLHSVVPEFGPGWDVTSITNITVPSSCGGDGAWGYYPAGWTGCNTGQVFAQGFAYNSSGGVDGSCPEGAGNPGNNYGDGANGCVNYPTPTPWCWRMNVRDCPPATNTFTGEDLSITIAIYSDGDAGSWTQTGCNSGATFDVLASVVVCDDAPPLAFTTGVSCPGTPDGTITFSGNGGFDSTEAFNFTVRNDAGDDVFVCNGCTGEQLTDNLLAGEYNVEAINLTNSCPRSVFVTVDDAPAPDAIPDFQETCPGAGPIRLLGSTTFPGTVFEYNWTGPGGYVSADQNPFTADPAIEGSYTLIVTVDGCAGMPTDVDVAYVDFNPTIAVDNDFVCFGDDVTFTVTDGGDTYEWFDPAGTLLAETGPVLNYSAQAEGLVTITVITTDVNGCAVTLTQDIFIADEIAIDIQASPSFVVCESVDGIDPDITFFAVQTNGNVFPPGWIFDWDNGSGSGPSYAITGTAPGDYLLELTATNPEGCVQVIIPLGYSIFELPTVTVTPLDPTICFDGSVTLMATAASGEPNYDLEWFVNGSSVSTDPTLTVDIANPADDFYVQVTDNFGCINFSTSGSVEILPELPAVTFADCNFPNMDEMFFDWDDVGQQFFNVYVTIDGVDQPVQEVFNSELLITGVMSGTSVTVRVVPVSNSNNIACEGLENSISCINQTCPELDPIITTPAASFCSVNTTTVLVDLTATVPGSGTLTWSGLGVTGSQFDPAAAGVGAHTIVLVYAEGTCTGDTTVMLTVVAPPSSDFTIAPDTICVGGMATMTYDGDATGLTFAWNFGAGATPTMATGAGPHQVTFANVGTQAVSLVASNAECTGPTVTENLEVVDLPADPVVSCENVNFDQVGFTWSHPNTTDFTVVIVSQPAGATVDQTGNTMLVTGMVEGESVTISVTAMNTGPCGDSAPVEQICTTRACPSITLVIDSIGPFCEGDDTDVALTAVATDSDGSGTLSWMQQNGTMSSTFNASTAAPGSYSVIATFEEMDCTFRDTFDITINPLPSSAFDLPDGPICTGAEVLGAVAGAAQAGFTYDFSAPGATLTPGVDAASRSFSWTAPGRYFVSLTVTSASGCTGAVFTDSIDVVAQLLSPVVTCDTVTMESVTFTWPAQANADSFGISVDSGPIFFQDSNTLFVGGLSVDQVVNISVEAFGGAPCPNPTEGTASCTSVACPQLFVALPADTTFCFMDAPLQYLLTTTVVGDNGGGTLTFSGPGVVQAGADYFFDLDVAGVGEHLLTVDFQEGMCTSIQTFTYTVTQIPLSNFEVNGVSSGELNAGVPFIEVCAGDLLTVEYTGGLIAADSAVFYYSYSPIEPTLVDTLGFETHRYQFDSSGTYRICLEVKLDSCTSTKNFFDVICVSPPPPPIVNCTADGRSSIVFSWSAVPEAAFYTILLEDGTEIMTTDLEYVATGLAPGESVTIEVTADAANGCADSGSIGTVTCNTEPCDFLEADLSSIPDQICILDGTEFVSLTEITIDGENGAGTYTFSGMGVSQDTFFAGTVPFDETGTTYTVTLNYEETGPCPLDTTFDITVFRRPMAFFLEVDTQCLGDTTLITVGSANPIGGNDVMTDFADGTVVVDGDPNDTSYLVVFPSAGTRTITAMVISNISGCPSEPVMLDIEVVAPLPAPALMCSAATLETVEITWADVPEATGFTVTISNGQNETLPAGSTTYEATGLSPSSDVTFTVTALGDAPCGNGPAQMITCRTMDCSGGVVQTDTPVSSQCLDGNEATILLEASLTSGDPFNGPIVWSGPGVVDNGDGTFSFDPVGLTAGDYPITVSYDGPANCDSEASVTLTLFDVPVISFNAMPTQLCQGEDFNLFFTGTAEGGDEFVWDFDGAVVNDLGMESYLLRWDTPGDRTVLLTVNGNCSASASFDVRITPTLSAPVVSCARQDLDGVFFTWPTVAEATVGYRVSVNGGPYGGLQTNTDFFVGDLAFGESVTITVVSVRSGTNCDESAPSAAVDCAARECPDVILAPSSPQTSFCDGDTEPVLLNANLSGDDGTGELVWTGPGVVTNNGVLAFDPVLAGIGNHTLTVMYTQETLCVYSATLTMMVNASPAAVIAQGTNVTCSGTAVSFGLNGTPDPATTYTFDFNGAAVNDLGNENYEITFAAGGTYTVTLTAERNGCINTTSATLTVEEEASAGAPVDGALEVCAGTTEPIELTARVINAMEGGSWSTIAGGVPSGSLNATTGVLNPTGLGAGNYTFAYTVDGGACPEGAVEVMVNLLAAPIVDAGPEQLLTCTMGMVSLDGSNSESGDGYTYLWTNADQAVIITNADQQMIDVGQPGIYQLRVTNAIGCSAVSEVTVTVETEAPVMELEVSNITCFSSDNGAISVTNVNGGRPPYRFSVNGDDRGQSTLFSNLEAGAYDIQITDANGCFSNVILDLTQPDELTVRLQFPGDSSTTAAGTEIYITATVNGGNPLDTLIWQPDSVTIGDGQNGIQFVAAETQMISVTVVDELGCSATDQMMLLVRRDRPVYFPTAFSPNGDNNNDIFFIGADLDQVDFITDLLIFDRWGEAVYTGLQNRTGGMGTGSSEGFPPNDPAFGWDGLFNGNTMNPQVLVYTATVHFSDGEVVVYKGDFMLMR